MINELNDCRSHFLSQEFKVKSNFFFLKKRKTFKQRKTEVKIFKNHVHIGVKDVNKVEKVKNLRKK